MVKMNANGRRRPLRTDGPSPMVVDDVLYSGSDDDYYDSPHERHRQYKVQARRYQLGRPINIISAQLKGPFTKESGWQNPWLGRSRVENGPDPASAIPMAQSSFVSRSDNPAIHEPGSATRTDNLEYGSRHITGASAKIDRTPELRSAHVPDQVPVSSYPRDVTGDPHMPDASWSRVQAWRLDVAAQTEEVAKLQTAAPPDARAPSQSTPTQTTATQRTPTKRTPTNGTPHGNRPANSQLLRSVMGVAALTKPAPMARIAAPSQTTPAPNRLDAPATQTPPASRFHAAAAARKVPVREVHLAAAPDFKPAVPVPTTSRGKRPANSELLRSALAKKRRSSGLDLSMDETCEPLSTMGQNISPLTALKQECDTPSTPGMSLYHHSHLNGQDVSEAVIDGSVAGQTTISRAARKNTSPVSTFSAESPFSTPARAIVARNEVGDVPKTPRTPPFQPMSPSAARRSSGKPKTPCRERSPLRPNASKINAIITIESHSQESRKVLAARDIIGLTPPVVVTETQEVDFCTQADRSFQYRSKAPRFHQRRALVEVSRDASLSSSTRETAPDASESSLAKAVEVPGNQSKEGFSADTVVSAPIVTVGHVSPLSSSTETASEDCESLPVEVAEKKSKEAFPADPAVRPDRSAPMDDSMSRSDTSKKSNVIVEETGNTTVTGIDGPTLAPTSSASSLQRVAPGRASSRFDKGPDGGDDIGRYVTDKEDTTLQQSNSISKPYTSPGKLAKITPRTPSPGLDPAKIGSELQSLDDHLHAGEEDSNMVTDTLTVPSSRSRLNSLLDHGGEAATHITSQNPEPSSKSLTSPGPGVLIHHPQQQSPWVKEVIHITQATPNHQAEPRTPATPIEAPISPRFSKTPRNSKTASTPMHQSPWTKEDGVPSVVTAPSDEALATVDVARSVDRAASAIVAADADMPPVPPADNAKQILQDTEAVEITASQNPWTLDEMPWEAQYVRPTGELPPLSISPEQQPLHPTHGAVSSSRSTTPPPVQRVTAPATEDIPEKHVPPSTPTQQSSLPTPDLTSSIKSFREFMSPTPEPRRRSNQVLFSTSRWRIEKSKRRKSAISNNRKDRAKRSHLRVSFALPGDNALSSPVTTADPDETLDGAELPTREAASPSLVRKATSQAPSRRASSPPLELSQSELPAEGTKFSKFFKKQARKGPQVKRITKSYKPLLPSASQQVCGSPEPDAMAEAFIEADRTVNGGSADPSQEEQQPMWVNDQEQLLEEEQEEETQGTDDVTAVLDNLDDFLNSFNVDAELDKARREEQRGERPQELGLGFPSTQDQMDILGAGVWD
ncbi:hypothetical protein GE09DRAFT_1079802 [Coniochaeta sp. 2T2.1]|nr:hypothetical protein GE09DRAFT_1079802 [Coniochaeta sp. 2T2.1]